MVITIRLLPKTTPKSSAQLPETLQRDQNLLKNPFFSFFPLSRVETWEIVGMDGAAAGGKLYRAVSRGGAV